MLDEIPKKRRDRVDWYAAMVRLEAGESVAVLAAEMGCHRRSVYRAWGWFSRLSPAERGHLQTRAFRRLLAKIESDALRGDVEGAGRSARGLETVRRLLEALEDDMKRNDATPAPEGPDETLTPMDARAEILERVARFAERRESKAIGGDAAGRGGDLALPGAASLGADHGADTAGR